MINESDQNRVFNFYVAPFLCEIRQVLEAELQTAETDCDLKNVFLFSYCFRSDRAEYLGNGDMAMLETNLLSYPQGDRFVAKFRRELPYSSARCADYMQESVYVCVYYFFPRRGRVAEAQMEEAQADGFTTSLYKFKLRQLIPGRLMGLPPPDFVPSPLFCNHAMFTRFKTRIEPMLAAREKGLFLLIEEGRGIGIRQLFQAQRVQQEVVERLERALVPLQVLDFVREQLELCATGAKPLVIYFRVVYLRTHVLVLNENLEPMPTPGDSSLGVNCRKQERRVLARTIR